MIDIEIQNACPDAYTPSEENIQHWIKVVLSMHCRRAQIGIRIMPEKEMQTLNAQYRQKDRPTNVLSFPYQLSPLEGDIAICASIVNQESSATQKAPEAHWAHIIIHGVLHLLGYNHEDDHDAEIMENLEIGILGKLGYNNPYEE